MVLIFAATIWNVELKLLKFYNRELFTFHSCSASLVCHRLSRKDRGSNIKYVTYYYSVLALLSYWGVCMNSIQFRIKSGRTPTRLVALNIENRKQYH